MSTQVAASAPTTVTLEDSVCRVAGTLDFSTAPAALNAVSAHILSTPSLRIDLGDVSSSNSAGLALIIEWLAVGRRAGHTVTFDQIPDGLRQLAGVCQVDGLI